MRIGLIGDVHHEDLALAWALGELQERQVDLVVCVGDISDGYGDLDACCELLESHGVVTVRGNHDRWFLAQERRDLPQAAALSAASEASRQWLAELPVTRSLATPAGLALLCHGLGADDMAEALPAPSDVAPEFNPVLSELARDDCFRILICGHTHRPTHRQVGSLTVVNAGTLHRDYEPCVGILDAVNLQTEFIQLPAFARLQ